MRLDEGDLSACSTLFESLVRRRNETPSSNRRSRAWRTSMPCLVATANEVDPVGGRLTFWKAPARSWCPTMPPKKLLTELAAEHPLIRRPTATGDGSAWRISDFWSQDMFDASRLHRDLYGPMGVEYQMSATFPAAAPVVFGLVVSRADRTSAIAIGMP